AAFSAGILRILWLGLVADRLGRREAVVDGREVVVFVLDRRLTRLVGTLRVLHLLRCRDDAEVVLGVLQVVLGHDVVTGGLGVARELQVLLGNVGGVAAHLHVGAVAFIVPAQRVEVLAPAIVVPAPRPVLVLLVRSHRLVSSLWMRKGSNRQLRYKAACAVDTVGAC